MNPRLNLEKTEPAAFKAMYALVKYMGTSTLNPTQLNSCAFCLDMHTREARHQPAVRRPAVTGTARVS